MGMFEGRRGEGVRGGVGGRTCADVALTNHIKAPASFTCARMRASH